MTNSAPSQQSTDLSSLSTCSDSKIAGRLDAVMKLWRGNSDILGRFPKGAFEDASQRGWIHYLIKDDQVVGYILYRLARGRAAIAHFCIDEELRGCGAARYLFESFKNHIDDGNCRGIELRCREDYDVNSLWPKLGFDFAGHAPGRAKQGSVLAVWFRRFDVNEFFYDMLPKEEDDDLAWAVLDANIVYKLSMPDDPTSEESLSLISDAVAPYSRFFVTPEIHTEIQRKKDRRFRQRSTKYAKTFEQIEARPSEIERFIELLKPIWTSTKKDRDRSDLKHVAITAAYGIQNFITLDTGILDRADEIFDLCSVQVMRPVDFVIALDELENSGKYSPQALARTQYEVRCPKADELEVIAETFCVPSQGEKRKALEARLRAHLSHGSEYTTIVVSSATNKYEALLSFRHGKDKLRIELMRHVGTAASRAITQNLIWEQVSKFLPGKTRCVLFSDEKSQHTNEGALKEIGFFPNENGWAMLSATTCESLANAKASLSTFTSNCEHLGTKSKEALKYFISKSDKECSGLEVAFWPLKITDVEIPTYILPIKPAYAMNLFDQELSERDLLGADTGRHFNFENVYYRSTKPLKAIPGTRLVWYVSSSSQTKTMAIRACSRLISSEIGPAKALFKKYRRLGIYQWSDLMGITKGNPHGEIMALRFHQTECFKQPIELSCFSDFGINGAPPGPRKLSNEQFTKIYTYGMQIDEQ